MNNRRTFGARYAVGGRANMGDNRGASPILGGRIGAATPMQKSPPAVNQQGAGNRGGGGGGGGGGGRMPQRIENLQNRLENRREKIQNLKGQLNAARPQAPLQQNVVPPGQAGGSVAAPPPSTYTAYQLQNAGPQGGITGQSMYGQGGPMSQQMGRAAFDNPNSPYSIAKNAMNQGEQGGYGQDAGYGDMGGQQDMVARDRSIYGRPIGGDMGGYGDNMYGDQGGYGQDTGGYDEYSPNAQQMDYGQQGDYGQYMGYGQDMGQQNTAPRGDDPGYIRRTQFGTQATEQANKAKYGTMPGDKNYVQKMQKYYEGQGWPFPKGLQKHYEKEQAYALNAMGQTPPKQGGQMTKDIKLGMSKRPPARTKDIRPGTKKQLPARTKDIRPGTKKQAPVRGKAAGGSSKAGGKQGGKRFAAGGVVPRPAAARPGMKGGGLARKGVGMALKGGGLARKGVGMALKSGGMVRGAGCAQRGRGKAK